MFKVTFLTEGSLPQGPFSEIGRDFSDRLKKFVDLEFKSVKNADRLLDAVPKDTVLVVLEATGKQFTSEHFAQKLQSWVDNGQKLTIILGGPHGVPQALKDKANLLLSLSPMTTTHDLAHLFFLEQFYRAFTITKGMTYHY